VKIAVKAGRRALSSFTSPPPSFFQRLFGNRIQMDASVYIIRNSSIAFRGLWHTVIGNVLQTKVNSISSGIKSEQEHWE